MFKNILVLMSTYNGEKYVSEQIVSIMEQKCQYNIYLKIRDDGSSDKTCDIIKKMQTEYPNRIELIEGINIGCNRSFFELINSSDGYDYYSISDQDDIWLPDKIETAIDWLEKENEDSPLLYASTSYLTHDDLKPYGQTRKKQREFTIYNTIIQTICPGHTQVFNQRFLKQIQGDIDFSRLYMYDLWTTNIAVLYGKILFDNESHTYYRQHKNNQLGSGTSSVGKLFMSVKRAMSNDGLKIREQAKYFIEKNRDVLVSSGDLNVLTEYVNATGFLKRSKVMLKGKFYRQSRFETFAFYVALMIGKM